MSENRVAGFLGPNGAGKTTTIRILATLARPDGGAARFLGFDVVSETNAIGARVAVTGPFAALDDDLTGYENLVVLGRLRGLSRTASRRRADELLAAFDLAGSAGRPVGGYSGGVRRRLDIGASLIVTRELLFLDEPTDPVDTGRLVGHAITRLSESPVAVTEITLGRPSLHEAFFALTGRPAQPPQAPRT